MEEQVNDRSGEPSGRLAVCGSSLHQAGLPAGPRMLRLSATLQKRLFYVMVGPVGSRLNIDMKLPAALEPKFSKVGFHLIKVTCRPLLLAKQ